MGKFNTYAALVWSPFHDKGLIFHSSFGNCSSITSYSNFSGVTLACMEPGAKFLDRACYWTIPLLADVIIGWEKVFPCFPRPQYGFVILCFHSLSHNRHEMEVKLRKPFKFDEPWFLQANSFYHSCFQLNCIKIFSAHTGKLLMNELCEHY